MQEFMSFETLRLRLRQWEDRDYEPFARMNADPHVMEFFPKTLSAEESNEVAKRIRAFIATHGWGFWAVEDNKTKQFIGFVGLNIPRADLPFSPCVEIGWRLGFTYWGKGYATEAACAALDVGFRRLGLPEIVSFTAWNNLRSQAVMERIGMHRVPGEFVFPGLPSSCLLRRHVLFSICKKEMREEK